MPSQMWYDFVSSLFFKKQDVQKNYWGLQIWRFKNHTMTVIHITPVDESMSSEGKQYVCGKKKNTNTVF